MDFGDRVSRNGACVDTVRALHQTIISLRAALEQSRSEVVKLKSKSWPVDIEDAFRKLSIENCILRERLSGVEHQDNDNFAPNEKSKINLFSKPSSEKLQSTKCLKKPKQERRDLKEQNEENSDCDSDPNIYISTETISSSKVFKSLENLSSARRSTKEVNLEKKLTKSRTVSFSNVFDGNKQISTTNTFYLGNYQNRKGDTSSKSKVKKNRSTLASLTKADNDVAKSSKIKAIKRTKKTKNLEFLEESVSNSQEISLSRSDFADVKDNLLKVSSPKSKKIIRQPCRETKADDLEYAGTVTRDLVQDPVTERVDDNHEEFYICVEKTEELLEEIKQLPNTEHKSTNSKKTGSQRQIIAADSKAKVFRKQKKPVRVVSDSTVQKSDRLSSSPTFSDVQIRAEQATKERHEAAFSDAALRVGTHTQCFDVQVEVEQRKNEERGEFKDDEALKPETQIQESTPLEFAPLNAHSKSRSPEHEIEELEAPASRNSSENSESSEQKSPELGKKLEEALFAKKGGPKKSETYLNTSLNDVIFKTETSEISNSATDDDTGVQSLQTVDKSELQDIECHNLTLSDSIDQKASKIDENKETEEGDLIESKEKDIAPIEVEAADNSLKTEEVFITNEKPEQETEEKEKDETDSSNTPNSSGSTTEKTVNNVEISVKIFRGAKKPIEVDIQTKTLKKGEKKISKTEMNDKSQNTSFDNDVPPLTQTDRRTPNNEIRGTVNAQNSQNVIHNSENIVENLLQNDAEQEVDDIELIFTTDDTKETDFKEELVSIEPYTGSQLLQCADYDEKADVSDRELEDDVFNDNFENENQENCTFQSQTFDFRRENSQLYNSKSDNSINHEDRSLKSYYSYQDSSFENKSLEKDESFDRFEENVRIVETDISKVGIQDVDYNMGRRNTCPNPLQYRPMMHREALGRGLNSRKCRPILAHSNVGRKESGVQTDISAIPGSSWRSESSLGHKVKVGENFTTLPSKFPHPGSRLRLSEKTVEARRVLLSDIGFTSMVPELSRSADYLCPPNVKAPTTTTYGQFLRTTDLYSPGYTSQKFAWTTTATPSEGSHSQSRYSSQYPLSSPPAPTRRCSAPVSPSRRTTNLKSAPSRVRFANGSLPELRGDWNTTVDSGESTDSLVEEAEHFLRRSIDCLAPYRDVCFRSEQSKGSVRRASAPEPSRDNVPPQGWQPFLPRVPRDLHLDYWVKVISQEGRVRGGRVRYVGPLLSQSEQFVGVQLSTPDGHSDGTFNNRRYFNSEPYHGIFVPFKKIIMGWRP